jgi:hypothetical protein
MRQKCLLQFYNITVISVVGVSTASGDNKLFSPFCQLNNSSYVSILCPINNREFPDAVIGVTVIWIWDTEEYK